MNRVQGVVYHCGSRRVCCESVPACCMQAQIRERNPDFVGLLPIPERDRFAPTEPPPVPEPAFANPDWDEWEYRYGTTAGCIVASWSWPTRSHSADPSLRDTRAARCT